MGTETNLPSKDVASPPDPIACRMVARWLYHFASVIEGFAVSHALSGDDRGADTLKEHAREIQAVAARLDDQGGIISDAEYLVILLQQARCYVYGESKGSRQFMGAQDILEGIERHAPTR